MAHIFSGDFSKLESEERKRILPVDEILNTVNVKKGGIVIDFGCGIGYFSMSLLELVGDEGKVIGIDVSAGMLQELRRRAGHKANLELFRTDNISGFKGDLILLVDVLHEVDDPEAFLKKCIESLNHGGKLVLIDWQKKETGMGPPMSHRIPKENILKMVDRKIIEHEIHDSHYFLEII